MTKRLHQNVCRNIAAHKGTQGSPGPYGSGLPRGRLILLAPILHNAATSTSFPAGWVAALSGCVDRAACLSALDGMQESRKPEP